MAVVCLVPPPEPAIKAAPDGCCVDRLLRQMVVASTVTCTQVSGVAVSALGTTVLGRGQFGPNIDLVVI